MPSAFVVTDTVLVPGHLAVRRCSAAIETSFRRAALRRPRRRPHQGNIVYKALHKHWIYDPWGLVYPDTPPELVEQLPLQESTTHTDPGPGSSLCPRRDPSYCGPQTQTRRRKFIDVRYHFLLEIVQTCKLKLLSIPKTTQKADIFTKTLKHMLYNKHNIQIQVSPSRTCSPCIRRSVYPPK